MLELLTQLPWANRIGWALVHSLWQFALVALLATALQRALARRSALARYWTLLAGLVLLIVMPIATWFSLESAHAVAVPNGLASIDNVPDTSSPEQVLAWPGAIDVEAVAPLPEKSAAMAPAVPRQPQRRTIGSAVSWSMVKSRVEAWLPEIVLVWLVGVSVAAMRPLLSWRTVRRLRTAGVSPGGDAMQRLLRRTAEQLGVGRAVQLFQSSLVRTPVLVGYFRPVILLPLCVVSGLPEPQLEMILAHELAHIRRHDYLINLCQTLIESLFFYHPAVWWLSRQIRNERENCCDDVAMSIVGSREDYGRALLAMEELRTASTPLALAARGGSLLVRIQRIAECEPTSRVAGAGSILGTVAIAIGILAAAAWTTASSAEKPEVSKHRVAEALIAKAVQEAAPARSELVPPSSMSAEEFARLSAADQRALLVRAFEWQVGHLNNVYFEVDALYSWYENRNGEIGAVKQDPPSRHTRYRHWRLGDSFREDSETFDDATSTNVSFRSSLGNNAEEGVARYVHFSLKGERPPQGQVQYPISPNDHDPYIHWLSHSPEPKTTMPRVEYLFPYLLEHQSEYEIAAPVDGDFVRLSFPWKTDWAEQPGGQRVYLLDPKKGFLPVRCDSRYDDPPTDPRRMWRIEQFLVEESRLVDDVWTPVRLTEAVAGSPAPDQFAVFRITVSRMESGTVKLPDLFIPFPEGTRVQDVLEGATYVVDAEGNASNVKFESAWWQAPPAGWSWREPTGGVPSWRSRFLAPDRERLDAASVALSEKTDQQKVLCESALKVMQSSAPLEDRVEAGLKVLRSYTLSSGRVIEENSWASVVRGLIEIGKPAVPKLTEELDRTERDLTIRALAFVLRGIADPRAVPALIRVIPRMAPSRGSDFSLVIRSDPKLAQFMLEHGHDYDGKPGQTTAMGEWGYFSYGRPIYEVMPTLERMTGQSFEWKELRFVQSGEGAEQQRLQGRLFLHLAEQWADWWVKNWQNYVDREDDAELELIKRTLERYAQTLGVQAKELRPEFPHGPKVRLGEGTMISFIKSFEEGPADALRDLDTGRYANPPIALIKNAPNNEPSPELLDWAEREGVDIVSIKRIDRSSGKAYYAFQPVNMKVWRIDNNRYDRIQEELRQSKSLDLPAPWKGPLAQLDEKTGEYNEKLTVSFLFMTGVGMCGVIQLRSPLSTPMIQGSSTHSDGGLRYQFIYEDDSENSPASRAPAGASVDSSDS